MKLTTRRQQGEKTRGSERRKEKGSKPKRREVEKENHPKRKGNRRREEREPEGKANGKKRKTRRERHKQDPKQERDEGETAPTRTRPRTQESEQGGRATREGYPTPPHIFFIHRERSPFKIPLVIL
jgi:hypothetical protein